MSRAIGNRSVEEWRDSAWDGFLSRETSRPTTGASSVSNGSHKSAGPAGVVLPPLPPLPQGCAQSRRRSRQIPKLKPEFEGIEP